MIRFVVSGYCNVHFQVAEAPHQTAHDQPNARAFVSGVSLHPLGRADAERNESMLGKPNVGVAAHRAK